MIVSTYLNILKEQMLTNNTYQTIRSNIVLRNISRTSCKLKIGMLAVVQAEAEQRC